MTVITLTTEWRPDDIYNGIIKGKLCNLCPGTVIIDNAINIQPFNIAQASFIIRNTYNNYPKGSVHIICVHSEAIKGQDHLLVRAKDHNFIGTDNGIFNLILNSEPEEVIRIDDYGITDELEVYARAAAHVLAGKPAKEIGKALSTINEKLPLRATIDKDVITGSVIFIDSYGNAFSNITREVFNRVFGDRKFRILIQSNKNYTDTISERYSDVPVGEMLARFNNFDLLEISINGADVSELLGLETGSVIRIDSLSGKKSNDHLF